jgi:hypothetical protein
MRSFLKWPYPIFVIISPLMRTWPLICKILNSLYLWMMCSKFNWNSEYLLFCHYLHSEPPLPTDDLCQLCLKLAQRFWRSQKCKCLIDRQTTGNQKSSLAYWINSEIWTFTICRCFFSSTPCSSQRESNHGTWFGHLDETWTGLENQWNRQRSGYRLID